MKWVTFASNFPRKDAERLATVKDLNEDLAQKSVLLGDRLKPSVDDILVFCALHIFVSHLPNENLQSTFTNVARWMDYIQNIEDFAGVFDKIVLNNPEFDFVVNYLWWRRTEHVKPMIIPFRIRHLTNMRALKKICANCSPRNIPVLIKLDLNEFTEMTVWRLSICKVFYRKVV